MRSLELKIGVDIEKAESTKYECIEYSFKSEKHKPRFYLTLKSEEGKAGTTIVCYGAETHTDKTIEQHKEIIEDFLKSHSGLSDPKMRGYMILQTYYLKGTDIKRDFSRHERFKETYSFFNDEAGEMQVIFEVKAAKLETLRKSFAEKLNAMAIEYFKKFLCL